ncbi:MAG: endonuclease domain-containing protein [Ruminococcaceae bacterium]|nr:endonuclease domain-containing protein [Oscillospiraceae bacterium]
MTKEERHLWYDFLSQLPITINRQKVLGNYIVDFYCASENLVIELDGSQHYTSEGVYHDTERDNYLKGLGLTVLRYTNLEIKRNFRGVCEDILQHISIDIFSTSSTVNGPPSPQGEG